MGPDREPNKITPSSFQVPLNANRAGTSQTVWLGPPLTGIFLILPSAKKPTVALSDADETRRLVAHIRGSRPDEMVVMSRRRLRGTLYSTTPRKTSCAVRCFRKPDRLAYPQLATHHSRHVGRREQSGRPVSSNLMTANEAHVPGDVVAAGFIRSKGTASRVSAHQLAGARTERIARPRSVPI